MVEQDPDGHHGGRPGGHGSVHHHYVMLLDVLRQTQVVKLGGDQTCKHYVNFFPLFTHARPRLSEGLIPLSLLFFSYTFVFRVETIFTPSFIFHLSGEKLPFAPTLGSGANGKTEFDWLRCLPQRKQKTPGGI